MKPVSYWVCSLCWTVMESAHLLADVEPDPAADPHKLEPDIARWYRDVKDAVTSGRIKPVGQRSPGVGNTLLNPSDVVEFAHTRETPDLRIPDQFRDIKRKAKPLRKRERDTLLIIIAALARAAKIDISMPSKAAAAIEKLTSGIGARVSARAIEDHLKLIPGAVEDRPSS